MPATALLLAAAETAFPAVLGRAVDSVTGRAGDRPWVWWCVALVVLLMTADVVDDLASGGMTANSTAWLRMALIRRLLRLGTRTDGHGPGDVVNRVVGNTADGGRIGSELVRGCANLIPVVGGIVALALMNVWLLATYLLGAPVAIFIIRSLVRDSSEAAAGYFREQGRIAGALAEAMTGARTIAAAGTQQREFERVVAPLPSLHRWGVAMWRAQTKALAQDSLLVPLLEVAVLAVAGVELSQGNLSAGEVLAAGQYVVLASGFSAAITTVQQLARSRAAAERVAEIMEQPPVTYGVRRLPPGNGRVEFRNVTVRAEGKVLLDRVDLDIAGGSLVAVVGPSGSGKSVLAAVVGRLIDPDEGAVLLDGVDVRAFGHRSLRKAVTYGFERPFLIGTTIEDAIAFGVNRPGRHRVAEAARAARADVFIEHMPCGYRTRLSEVTMSGGEVQRVGLARAFAHPGRVMVLDDVASRLDTVTEFEIAKVLTEPYLRQTRIVVAHRASTAASAHAVVWIERGKVRAVGTHCELWERSAYRRLFQPPGSSKLPPVHNAANGLAR